MHLIVADIPPEVSPLVAQNTLTGEGNVLSSLLLTWLNIHSLNTENSVFLKERLPVALVVHGATHDPPYTISNKASCKVFGKKRVSNHGLVKLANSSCVNVKKRFQELEESCLECL